MSREEAIKELTDLLPEEFLSEYTEAIKMGIEALEQEPCYDCIRRSDIGLTDFEIIMCNGDYREGLKILLEKIAAAPSVTPMPKMGKWIGVNPMVDTLMCSECGENIISEEFKSNYCPNCGSYNGGEE
jgi:hypothetical protein